MAIKDKTTLINHKNYGMNGNLATLNEFFVKTDTKGLHYINIFLNDYS